MFPCIASRWACFPGMAASDQPDSTCLLLVSLNSFEMCEVGLDWISPEDVQWENYGKRQRDGTTKVKVSGVVSTTKGLIVTTNKGIVFVNPFDISESRYLSTFPAPTHITVPPT